MKIDKLTIKYHDNIVGMLSLTPDDRLCAFEYDRTWLADGFSISPLELPLKTGLFIAKPQPFHGNFGIFEDSLPDGYGRYLLHKALQPVVKYSRAFSERLEKLRTAGYEPHSASVRFVVMWRGEDHSQETAVVLPTLVLRKCVSV